MKKYSQENRVIDDIRHAEELVDIISKSGEDIEQLLKPQAYNYNLLTNLAKEENYKLDNSKKEINTLKFSEAIRAKQRKARAHRIYARYATVAAMIITSFMVYYYTNSDATVVDANISTGSLVAEVGKIEHTIKQSEVYLPNKPALITTDGKVAVVNNDAREVSDVASLVSKAVDGVVLGSEKNVDLIDGIKSTSLNRFMVPARQSSSIMLSDGTVVYLNANSELIFPDKFEGETRSVELKGEGYFDVTKSDKQFVVKANGLEVKVYGTKFNVNAYNASDMSTTLIEGVVGVNVDNKELYRLAPNDHFNINNITGEHDTKQVNTRRYIAWLDNNFMFEKERFETMVNELWEWYGVDIDIKNDKLRDKSVTLIVSRDSKLSEILEMISNKSVKYEKTERGYIIR